MVRFRSLAASFLLVLAAAPSQAASFLLSYTTFADGVNAPVFVSATIEAEADPYVANGYLITAISGTRGGVAIDGFDDFTNEFYVPTVPGYGFQSYVDSFGFAFTAGGVSYNVYRSDSDTTFYHEFADNGVGLLIQPNALSITPAASPVPEPASWALMGIGFGAMGTAIRRERRQRAAA